MTASGGNFIEFLQSRQEASCPGGSHDHAGDRERIRCPEHGFPHQRVQKIRKKEEFP